MDTIDRKILLIRRGIKQAHIAAKLGVSRSMVSRVIAGQRTSRRIRTYISRQLDIKVKDLWPPDVA